MPTMTEKRPKKPGKPRNPARRAGEPINVWVRQEIMAALRSYLAASKPRVSKTAAVEEALEAFLSERGFRVTPAERESESGGGDA